MKREIPIVLICDGNFIMQTAVTITSVIANKSPQSIYYIHIIMAECAHQSEHFLLDLNKKDCHIEIIHRDLSDFSDINQLAHISRAGLLKFYMWNIVSGYDKLLYLDSDIIVRGDLWELYQTNLGEDYIAGVKELICIYNGQEQINSGIMLVNAKKMRENQMTEILMEKRRSLGDRPSMDQQTINIVFNGNIKFLDIKYNCIPAKALGKEQIYFPIEDINQLYKSNYGSVEDVVKRAVIIHFASAVKPWKYNYPACSKEWFSYYKKSPFSHKKLKRYGKWGFRFHKIHEAYKKDGLAGMIKQVKDMIYRLKRHAVHKKGPDTNGWG